MLAARSTSGAVYLHEEGGDCRRGGESHRCLQKCAAGCGHWLMLDALLREAEVDDLDFCIRLRRGEEQILKKETDRGRACAEGRWLLRV